MPSKLRKPPVPPAGIVAGCYLTDGVRLYRVLEAVDGQVMLENCRHPNMAPQVLPLKDLLAKMRLVRQK